MKLSPGVNFINILCTDFSYEILVPKVTKLAFGFEILAPNILYEKRAHKMLMKLTPGEQSSNLKDFISFSIGQIVTS